MVWKARLTRVDYPENANRLRRRFAYFPVYIDGDFVWLQLYEVIQVYIIDVIETAIDGKQVGFKQSKWVDADKRLIPKK